MSGPVALAGHDDLSQAAARLAQHGHARIDGLLTEAGAGALHQAVSGGEVAWMRSLDNPANVDAPVALFEAQPVEEQARLVQRVHDQATDDFQYLFDRFRIDAALKAGAPAPEALFDVFRLFNSPPFLALARRLTGDERILHIDAQATRYLPGHFLNAHDDLNAAAGRLYAYVLNLTPNWRAEWGGLLMFMDAPDSVTATLTPRFNALNVFRVPQPHAVSMVAPFAGTPRYSITGWWRTLPD